MRTATKIFSGLLFLFGLIAIGGSIVSPLIIAEYYAMLGACLFLAVITVILFDLVDLVKKHFTTHENWMNAMWEREKEKIVRDKARAKAQGQVEQKKVNFTLNEENPLKKG